MKRIISAAALVLTLGLAALAGSAAAGNGNGNNGNGVGNAAPAAPAPAPAAAPGNSAAAPGQVKKTDAPQPATQQPATHGSSADHHTSTQTSHATTHTSPTHSSPTTQPGVKPSSTTDHWTHTTVGASPDVSKRYGNGQTAAGIAQSRGAPSDTQLTGPGNSQPHKVTVCGKPNNRSGGVDVHAVKSYDQAGCTTQTQQSVQQQQLVAPCGFTAVTTSNLLGMEHVNGQGVGVHLMTNTHSAHFSKHAEDVPMTSSTTLLVPNGEVCNTSVVAQAPTANTPAGVNVVTPAATPAGAAAPAGQAAASGTAAGAGSVLGAQASLASPHHSSGAHGVLGATAHVAGTSLPFTGLPLWVAVLIAAALIAVGSLFRRHSRSGARA